MGQLMFSGINIATNRITYTSLYTRSLGMRFMMVYIVSVLLKQRWASIEHNAPGGLWSWVGTILQKAQLILQYLKKVNKLKSY